MGSRTLAPAGGLRRTTDDRVVAGVCGGLAERAKIDAVAVRIVFVLGAMVWGLAVVVYAVLWRVLPERDSPTNNPVRPNRLPSLSIALGAVALMAALMLLLRGLGLLPPDLVVLPLSLAALGVMFLWAGQPLRPLERPALGSGIETDPQWTAEQPADEFEDDSAFAHSEPLHADPARERAPVPFGSALVGATLVVGCVGFMADRAGWVDVQWRLLGAVLLIVVGVILVGGSTRGRPTGLIGLGGCLAIALFAATVFQVPLGSGVGARKLHPIEIADADTHLAAGSLVIDLRDVAFAAEGRPLEHLDASVAVGDLTITIPAGVEVEIAARVGLGAVTLFDQGATGVSLDHSFRSSSFSSGSNQLSLVAQVGVGRIVVQQAPVEAQ